MNDYLDRVEAQLTELTERGAHRRRRMPCPPRPPRRGSEVLAFLTAAAVVAAVVAIVVLNVHAGQPSRATAPAQRGHNAPATTPTPTVVIPTDRMPTTPPTTPAVPAKFSPQSITAITELTYWLLGPGPCAAPGEQPPCGAIVRTNDGGGSFGAVAAPAAPLAVTAGGYTQLRFADGSDGYAYDPGLYATHDGGQTWHAIDVGGVVADLAISSGQVYAVVAPSNARSATSPRLMRSPVTQDAWTTVSAAGAVEPGLWVQGSDVIVGSAEPGAVGTNLLVSHDGGASFATHPSPSPGLPCQFEAPAPPVLWARCNTGMMSGVWRSTDLGANFTSVSPGIPQANSAAFAAASDTTAVYGSGQLYRTTDGGATWTPVGRSGIAGWAYLGFTDATHGVGLGYVGSLAAGNERLYYTTDAGQSYHLVSLP